MTNSFPSLPRFRIYSCYVALSSRNYVPRRLNSRQLLARSSLISLEIKDDNDGDGEDGSTSPPGETQYQREERDTNLTISRGTKTISPWMRFAQAETTLTGLAGNRDEATTAESISQRRRQPLSRSPDLTGSSNCLGLGEETCRSFLLDVI